MAKFHERAILMYGRIQEDPPSISPMAAENAIAGLEVNYSDEIATEDHAYVGDELDRDTLTSVTDRYSKADFSTLLPLIGAVNEDFTEVEQLLPITPFLQACGASVTAVQEENTPEPEQVQTTITFTNSDIENSQLELEVRRSSVDDPGFQRKNRLNDCRGMVNFELEMGKRSLLGFNFMGNYVSPSRVNETVPEFYDQKTRIAPVPRQANILNAELYEIGIAEPVWGDPGTKNFCFSKLSAPNLFGFDYSRFTLSCLEGFSKGAVTTDVVLTRLMDTPNTGIFMPEDHLEGLFTLRVVLALLDTNGDMTDSIKLEFSKLELANYANTTVGTYVAQDLTFKNRGFTTLEFINIGSTALPPPGN